ncbi:MAG: Trk system potassium transporter TrkA [Planctomycetota bacterium]
MNILICGAGEVGRHSAEVLQRAGHAVTVIDQQSGPLDAIDDTLDVRTLRGSGTQAEVLLEAGCATTELFIAATSSDEVNLLAASVAKGVGAKRCIARVHHGAYFEQRGLDYAKHLGVDHLVCPEYTTALAIAGVVRAPGASAVEQFARGKIEMARLPVGLGTKVNGVALRHLTLPVPARVVLVEHKGEAKLADADTIIDAGDVVTVIGETADLDKVRKVFQAEVPRRRSVMVVGGTTQSVWLCRALRHKQLSVRLFESDPVRAEELAEKLSWVTVLSADVLDSDVLVEEGVDQVDAFCAVSDDDETNILIAAQAKSQGARQSIAVLQRPTFLHLLKHVGIDRAFSPRSTAVVEIERRLEKSPVRKLAELGGASASVYEVRVTPAATEVVGRPLREVSFPEGASLAVVQRGDEVSLPTADSELKPGDVVIAICGPESIKAMRRMFGSRAATGSRGWFRKRA